MSALLARFLKDATAPLGAALFQGVLALVLATLGAFALGAAAVIANVALYVWLKTQLTPLQALGALAGAWLALALVCWLAAWITLRRTRSRAASPAVSAPLSQTAAAVGAAAGQAKAAAGVSPLASLADQVEMVVDPLAKTMTALGLRSESAALLAGATAFRSLRATQLAALALIVGYAASRTMGRGGKTGA